LGTPFRDASPRGCSQVIDPFRLLRKPLGHRSGHLPGLSLRSAPFCESQGGSPDAGYPRLSAGNRPSRRLFEPELKRPIKTFDLPLGGSNPAVVAALAMPRRIPALDAGEIGDVMRRLRWNGVDARARAARRRRAPND